MAAQTESDAGQVYIVGYGTFIPNETYTKSGEVYVCKIRGYRRVWPGTTIFPFVLPQDADSGFYGLVFSVSPRRLKKLDFYEGVEKGLFSRDPIEVELLDGSTVSAFIYVPTEATIEEHQLKLESDPEDRWMDEIRRHPGIAEKFPQLLQKL